MVKINAEIFYEPSYKDRTNIHNVEYVANTKRVLKSRKWKKNRRKKKIVLNGQERDIWEREKKEKTVVEKRSR